MSWSHLLRRVGYSVSLVLIAGLAFWAANQTLLANNTIGLSQVSPNAVTATATQPVRSWNHVFGSSSMTDCTTASYSNSNEQTSASLVRTITWTTGSRRDGNNLCVRTLVDTAEREYAYSAPLRIDLAGPTIRFESGRSDPASIQATVNDYNNLHTQATASTTILDAEIVSGVSFRYAILSSSSDCSVRNSNLRTDDANVTKTSTTANNFSELKVNVPVNSDNHDQYVCLKTTDRYGNVSYQSSPRLDTVVERVRLSLSNNQIRMTAGEILTSVWGEANNATSCSYGALAGGTPSAQGVTSLSIPFDIDNNDRIVCFHMTDRQSNSASYSYTLDTEDPSDPKIYQSGRIVIATSSDTDQRDATNHRGDNDFPADWGIKAWHSYFIDTDATTNLETTLDAACDADDYGKSGAADPGSNIDAWRAYSTRSSSNRLVLSSSHSRYEGVCFRATDQSGRHSYNHRALSSFESTDPVINGQRTNYQKEVTLTLSSTSKRATSWRWNAMGTNNETCDLSQIGSSTAPTTSNKIEVEDANIGGLFCVEVLLNDNSRVYQLVEAGTSPVDRTAPEISASWQRNSLRATATDDLSGVKSTTWQWQIITNPNNVEGSCQADEDANPKITSWRSGSNTGSLGTSRNGQFICFRVSDNVGNVGYANFEIEVVNQSTDTTKPAVNVSRNGKTVTASSPANDLPSVPDWRYVISHSSDCNENVFDNAGSNLGYGNSVQLVDGDDVWVCFQVRDSADNAGHGRIKVDLAGPTITVSQSGNVVTASANETASGWIYFRSDTYPDYCVADSEFNFNKRPTFIGRIVRNLTSADVGKYLCFRANDSHNNQDIAVYQISGPIGQPVQTRALTISFAQGPTQLVASANRAVASWRYLVYESAPTNCNSDNTYFDSDFAGHSHIVDLDPADDGRYYCFEANAADGTQAYASHRVNIASSPSTGTTTPQPVDLLTVTVDQDNGVLTASANRAVSSWRYLIYAANPANCDDTNRYFAANNGRIGRSNTVNLVASDEGKYYCFEAADANDNKAYAVHLVTTIVEDSQPEEVTPPQTPGTPDPVVNVEIERQNNQLVASADQTVTQWRWLIYNSQPTCDDSNTYFDSGSANLIGKGRIANLGQRSVGRYYCFRAKARDGQFGYAVHRVTRPVANPIVEEAEEADTQEPQNNQPAQEAIKISVSQTGRHLVAKANQPIAQWRYLVYATNPTSCNDDNNYFDNAAKIGKGNKAAWTTNNADRYYCFRAKADDGRTAYAVYLIPATQTVAEPVDQPQQQATPDPEPQPDQPPTTTRTERTSTTTVINVTAEIPAPDQTTETKDDDDQAPVPVDDVTPDQTGQADTPVAGDDKKDEVKDDEDDDLPLPWIIGGVAAAILVILLVFRPRRKYEDDEDENSHDLNV